MKNLISNRRTLLSSPYLLWVLGFTIIPMIVIFKYAFFGENGSFTLSNVLAMGDNIHLKATLFSLEIAAGCTVLCILLSYPLIMALRRLKLGGKGFSIFILILPMWMNFILRVLALQIILSNNGILSKLSIFLTGQSLHIANSWVAIMIGVVYDYFPFMALPIFNAITEIDEDIIDAARDLGAGPFTIFFKIILPLSKPGLFSGIVMVFVPSMTSFVVSDILGGGKLQLIGNIIEQEFTRSMDWGLGSGLSVVLMVFVMVSMAFTMKNDEEGNSSAIW